MTHRGSPAPSPRPARAPGSGRVGAVLVFTTVLTGCGGPTPVPREDGLAVAYDEPTGSGGDSALLTGVVEALDGCLVVRQDGSDEEAPFVPVFATDDSTARSAAEGETVELGGGWVPQLDADDGIPATCPADGPFWVVAQPE